MSTLKGKRILIFTGDIYEDLELWYPKVRLEEEGASVVLAGPEADTVYAGKNGYPCKSDVSYKTQSAKNYDGLVIPGGYMPDKLRRDQAVLDLTREFHEAGKMIAFICHAGWIPISAKVLKGVTLTSVNAIKDDLENAGAIWKDEPVVVDRHFISSRTPADLGPFAKEMIKFLS